MFFNVVFAETTFFKVTKFIALVIFLSAVNENSTFKI
jgi:hypothetical protein